jgi:hypothetical protein
MVTDNLEQHDVIRIYVKLGEEATDAYKKILKTFSNDSCALVSGHPAHVRGNTDIDYVRALIHQIDVG